MYRASTSCRSITVEWFIQGNDIHLAFTQSFPTACIADSTLRPGHIKHPIRIHFHAHSHDFILLPATLSGFSPTFCPTLPFSPGTFVALLSMPTVLLYESEATFASPGTPWSVWPGALSAPAPCSVRIVLEE